MYFFYQLFLTHNNAVNTNFTRKPDFYYSQYNYSPRMYCSSYWNLLRNFFLNIFFSFYMLSRANNGIALFQSLRCIISSPVRWLTPPCWTIKLAVEEFFGYRLAVGK